MIFVMSHAHWTAYFKNKSTHINNKYETHTGKTQSEICSSFWIVIILCVTILLIVLLQFTYYLCIRLYNKCISFFLRNNSNKITSNIRYALKIVLHMYVCLALVIIIHFLFTMIVVVLFRIANIWIHTERKSINIRYMLDIDICILKKRSSSSL